VRNILPKRSSTGAWIAITGNSRLGERTGSVPYTPDRKSPRPDRRKDLLSKPIPRIVWITESPKHTMLSYGRVVSRLGTCLGVICTLSSLPVVSQGLARPVKSIFGVYGQATAGHDSVRLTEKANDRIGVNLKLYFSNGHTCQLNQDGKWSEDHVEVVAAGLDANRPCRLNLFFENGRVLLKDEGSLCAPVYCGTRGKLDQASLPKFTPNRK